jgi:hypothetical protein
MWLIFIAGATIKLNVYAIQTEGGKFKKYRKEDDTRITQYIKQEVRLSFCKIYFLVSAQYERR